VYIWPKESFGTEASVEMLQHFSTDFAFSLSLNFQTSVRNPVSTAIRLIPLTVRYVSLGAPSNRNVALISQWASAPKCSLSLYISAPDSEHIEYFLCISPTRLDATQPASPVVSPAQNVLARRSSVTSVCHPSQTRAPIHTPLPPLVFS
jgi:hypothetical protein